MKRRSISRSGSRKYFTKSARGSHYKNALGTNPMRGGIRL